MNDRINNTQRHKEHKSESINKKDDTKRTTPVMKTVDDFESVPICTYYNGKEGSCSRGAGCRYRHVDVCPVAPKKEEEKGNDDDGDDEEEEANGGGNDDDDTMDDVIKGVGSLKVDDAEEENETQENENETEEEDIIDIE